MIGGADGSGDNGVDSGGGDMGGGVGDSVDGDMGSIRVGSGGVGTAVEWAAVVTVGGDRVDGGVKACAWDAPAPCRRVPCRAVAPPRCLLQPSYPCLASAEAGKALCTGGSPTAATG
eukprot:3208227-Prymnesium_polylepis.1